MEPGESGRSRPGGADPAGAGIPEGSPGLRRAMGWALFSNAEGVPLANEGFRPLYEVADALGAFLHVHPTAPVGVEAMTEHRLMPLVGFPLDTTLAAAHLVFAGPDRLLAGSDYPHQIGSIPKMLESLESLDLPEADRAAVLGEATRPGSWACGQA